MNEVTFYWARHTFANLAYNVCKISKDHIGQALNHVDEGHKTTDIYIEKDWAIVDNVQDAVISLLKPRVDENSENIEAIKILYVEDLKFLGSLVMSESLNFKDRKRIMELHYKLSNLENSL